MKPERELDLLRLRRLLLADQADGSLSRGARELAVDFVAAMQADTVRTHITDADCPDCGCPIAIHDKYGDQMVECPDCHVHWWAAYDASCEYRDIDPVWRGGYTLTRGPRPTEMDLRSDI